MNANPIVFILKTISGSITFIPSDLMLRCFTSSLLPVKCADSLMSSADDFSLDEQEHVSLIL